MGCSKSSPGERKRGMIVRFVLMVTCNGLTVPDTWPAQPRKVKPGLAVAVTGVLPSQENVSTASGDIFTPNKVAIAQGGQVTWTFGGVEHTVSFTSASGAPSGILSGGYSSSHSRTFPTPGNYSYVCTIHAGMSGQVIVR